MANTNPQIRFAGFTEDWAIDRFENLTKINQGLQIAISNRFTKPLKDGHFYITNEFLKEGSKTQYFIVNPPETVICNKDDILMTRTGNTGEVVTGVKGAFHNNFFKIKYDQKIIDKNFLFYFLKSDAIQKKIIQLAGVSTIPDLNHNDFYQIKFAFPNIIEQQQIGTYFQSLDKLILKSQDKLSKIENLNKTMLIKLFPKEGTNKPEIRFKGFSKSWMEKEFGEIFKYERPDNFIVSSSRYSSRYKTPVLTANKSFILGYTNETRTFNESCIIFDDFTLDNKFVDFPFMVKSSALKILSLQNKNIDDLKFAFFRLRTKKIEIMGHARHYISVVQKTKVLVPEINEQIVIANYFNELEKLTLLYEQEVMNLKNIKNALLSLMLINNL
jgi:type I restriction enzyme S subunit